VDPLPPLHAGFNGARPDRPRERDAAVEFDEARLASTERGPIGRENDDLLQDLRLRILGFNGARPDRPRELCRS